MNVNKHHINIGASLVGVLVSLMIGTTMNVEMAVCLLAGSVTVYLLRDTKLMQRMPGLSGCDEPSMAELMQEFRTKSNELLNKQAPLKDAVDELKAGLTDQKRASTETKEQIDGAIVSINETKANITDLLQKMDELKNTTKSLIKGDQPMTIKKALATAMSENQAKYDAFKNRDSRSLRLSLKAISTTDGAVGLLTDPYRDTLISMARQPLRIRDLLSTIPVTTDSVKYAKQNVRTNAAKIVAEGTAKPYSAYGWITQTATIETLAHLAKLTLQAIADAPRLQAEVEAEMRYGLGLVEEAELLNGDGTSGHLSGLMHNATAFSMPSGITTANVTTKIDVLRVAQLMLALQFAPADGQVISMQDWADIELLKDGQLRYLFSAGPTQLTNNKTLWGLPVVDSASMAVDNFLVGAFKYSASLYDRQDVNVLISTENDTDFEDNLATMRCEERIGLAVRRTEGLVKGTFTAAIPEAGGG